MINKKIIRTHNGNIESSARVHQMTECLNIFLEVIRFDNPGGRVFPFSEAQFLKFTDGRKVHTPLTVSGVRVVFFSSSKWGVRWPSQWVYG